jgi:mono/diheme cytochrome c family protein
MAMSPLVKGAFITLLALVVVGAVGAFAFLKSTGLSARASPGRLETTMARRLRAIAVPSEYSALRNPVLNSEESVRNGMEHFADHCATCHADDGSGNVEIGRGLFPPAPDMRQSATQNLSDGELFYIIEHGVRFTGMPAWGTGTLAGEESSWHLVNFIRHLPHLTEGEVDAMTKLNPRSADEVRQEIEEERFLAGDAQSATEPAPHSHDH